MEPDTSKSTAQPQVLPEDVADELDAVGSDLLAVKEVAVKIVNLADRLREETTVALGGAGYEWHQKLPPDVADLIDDIEDLASLIRGEAGYAWRKLRELAEDGG
ncbi:hypothetical protein [Mesorhizobium sp. M0244]|uniref:hypothetical protein n=1 Tax=Mesorhizobium sp. M0244 TaxID=2956926 RepID=UPI00333CE869